MLWVESNALPTPTKMLKTSPPEPVNVALFGNRDFADDQSKMRSSGWAPIQDGLKKRGKLDIETNMWGECHVRDEDKRWGCWDVPKIGGKPPEARERQGPGSSSQPSEATNLANAWSQTWSSLQNHETIHCCYLRWPVCGACDGSPS